MILALTASAEDRSALDQCLRMERVRYCEHVDELSERLVNDGVRAALIDVDAWPVWATAMLERAIARSETVVPLWLRVSPSPASVAKMLDLLAVRGVMQVWTRISESPCHAHGSAVSWLDLPLSEHQSATLPTLTALRPRIASETLPLFAIALLLAERSAPQAEVATALAVSPRELRRRLSRAGFPPFPDTMGLLFGLHASWRLSRLGWAIKRVAVTGGYNDGKAFAKYIRVHTGLAPGSLRSADGFGRVMERVRAAFAAKSRTGSSDPTALWMVAESDAKLAASGSIAS